MPRFTRFSPLFAAAVLFVLFLTFTVQPVGSFVGSIAAILPWPVQGNLWAAATFLGLLIASAFALALPTTPVVQRSRTRLRHSPVTPSRQSLHAPPPLKTWKGGLPPMFKYFGGKSRLAPRIVQRIPEHKTFVEPFAGGASVTLRKPWAEAVRL